MADIICEQSLFSGVPFKGLKKMFSLVKINMVFNIGGFGIQVGSTSNRDFLLIKKFNSKKIFGSVIY